MHCKLFSKVNLTTSFLYQHFGLMYQKLNKKGLFQIRDESQALSFYLVGLL